MRRAIRRRTAMLLLLVVLGVAPQSTIGGAEYLFPATALQGEGPFYVLIRADQSEHSLKLKRSALGNP